MTARRPPSPEEWPAVAEAALAALRSRWRLTGRGRAMRAACPAHGGDGRDRNLSVRRGPGGALELTCHSHGCDRLAILDAIGCRWGEDDGPAPPPATKPACPAPPPPERDRTAGAKALWTAAVAAGASPARLYFSGRGIWPPDRGMPPVVKWLERTRAPFPLNGWPEDAAGCIVYVFLAGRQPVAVQLEALAATGERFAWTDHATKRKSLGPTGAASMRLLGAGRTLHITESPSSALAIRTWTGAPVWCSAGAGTLPSLAADLLRTGALNMTMHCDGDPIGRRHALALQAALQTGGRACSIRWAAADPGQRIDPADALAADWLERRAILETDGMPLHDAAVQAWRDIPHPDTGDTPA